MRSETLSATSQSDYASLSRLKIPTRLVLFLRMVMVVMMMTVMMVMMLLVRGMLFLEQAPECGLRNRAFRFELRRQRDRMRRGLHQAEAEDERPERSK
jgi:hypothetical protein